MSVHTNTLLRGWGYLKLKPRARAMQTRLARRAVPLAKKLLARRVLDPRLAREFKRRTGSAIDWSKTRAFATPRTHQGVYINLAGREPYGIVPSSELDHLKEEIARRFTELQGPDGRPVTDRVWRSQEVFSGDRLEGAPDLVPVLRDHRYDLDDDLFENDAISDVTHLPRGVHHIDGIGVVAGPGVVAAGKLDGSVLDVTPTLLYLAGLDTPEGLDGSLFEGAFDAAALERRPVRTVSLHGAGRKDEESPYSTEEEEQIEEALRGLGYL
jgi:predicted AlkP superfamily phosphohydrolase/phosphomutase